MTSDRVCSANPFSSETDSADRAAATSSLQTSFQAITTTRSYEGVVRQIATAVRSGQLKQGERLPTERELSATFDVSRGVIREAIKVLGAMGLVEARQGSGMYVQHNTIPTVTRAFTLSVSPDSESIDRLFEFRRTLESEAARFAALRRSDAHLAAMRNANESTTRASNPVDWKRFGLADNEFHRAIARASGNPYLEVAVATARDMQQDIVNLIIDRVGSIRSAVAHHRAIVDAIADQDADEAARRMADHIDYTAAAVQSKIPPKTPYAAVVSRRGEGHE